MNNKIPDLVKLTFSRLADEIDLSCHELLIYFSKAIYQCINGELVKVVAQDLATHAQNLCLQGKQPIAFKVGKKLTKSIPDFLIRKSMVEVGKHPFKGMKSIHTLIFFGRKIAEFSGLTSSDAAKQALNIAKSNLRRGVAIINDAKCAADVGLNVALSRLAKNRSCITNQLII